MPNCYYHYVKRPGSLTDHMDIVQAYEMRAAYEYQELCLHQWFPEENFYYDINFYNSDMVILYTLIFSIREKINLFMYQLSLIGQKLIYFIK